MSLTPLTFPDSFNVSECDQEHVEKVVWALMFLEAWSLTAAQRQPSWRWIMLTWTTAKLRVLTQSFPHIALVVFCCLLIPGCKRQQDELSNYARAYDGSVEKYTISDTINTGEPPVILKGKDAIAFDELAGRLLRISSESQDQNELNVRSVSILREGRDGTNRSFDIAVRGEIYMSHTDKWYYPTRNGLLFVVKLLILRDNASRSRISDAYISMVSSQVQSLRRNAMEELHLEQYSEPLRDMIKECIETYNQKYAEPGEKIQIEGNRIR